MSALVVLLSTVGSRDFILPDKLKSALGRRQLNVLKSRVKPDWFEATEITTQDYIRLVETVETLQKRRNEAGELGKIFLDAERADPNIGDGLTYKDFPLIDSISRAVYNNQPLHMAITHIVLFATNSKKRGEPSRNTNIYAQIIKDHLLTIAKKEKFLCNCQTIEVKELDGDPALYDEMQDEIRKQLLDLRPQLQEYDRIFIAPAAGTPAMSFGLIRVADAMFEDKLEIVYPKEDSSKEGRFLRDDYLKIDRLADNLRQLVKSYDYAGARELVDAQKELLAKYKPRSQALISLLENAYHRTLFDFDKAESAYLNFQKLTNDNPDWGIDTAGMDAYYPLEFDRVKADGDAPLLTALRFGAGAIAELYWNTVLQGETGRYTDYLVRFKTLADRLGIFALELITGIPLSFEEASYNAAMLGKTPPDFSKLNGLFKIYGDRIEKTQDEKNKNVVTTSNVSDRATDIAYRICTDTLNHPGQPSLDQYIFDMKKMYIHNLKLQTQPKEPGNNPPDLFEITSEHFANFVAGKGEDLANLTNLLNLILDKNTQGSSSSRSHAMSNLTRLRNNLPPAHSFGSIDAALIEEAVKADWGDILPHLKIGEALANLKCWENYFGGAVKVSTDAADSPFNKINDKIKVILDAIQHGANPR